ncbi:helix-turn-helix transcriptional regulator [Zwartia sp.]|uniref:helix-turn-helix domain-containing protein n=1 Tax=Zwartia sp. TaxID=2978004 RepID=UPI0027224DC1|nr:helix-turn-helix transcriptional regulator [Zwartia sp.]MDO9024722.1 helix-turn-helix transcriptional regulator [Zwartia sp.]
MKRQFQSIKSTLANRLRDRRKELGLSQEAMADLTGIDRTYASQIERAVANPSLEVLVNIGDALNLDVADLLRDETRVHDS